MQVLKFDVEVAFNKLNGLIKSQLNTFLNYVHTKSICILQEAAFISVQSTCDSLRCTMQAKLEKLEKRVEVTNFCIMYTYFC